MTVVATLALQMLAVGAAAATPAGTSAAPAAPHVAVTADAPSAPASAHGDRCKSLHPQYGDTMQVQCTLRASDAHKKFKFEVRFLGGHDDTTASLSATLDGKPLTCEDGSKPQLEGEFGEVSIHCRFSIQDAQQLKVDVQWHHAQYSEFVLEAL